MAAPSGSSEDLSGYVAWAESTLGVRLHPSLRLGIKSDIDVSGVSSVGDMPQERAVYCTGPVKECEALVMVPWDALLKVEDILGTPFAKLASTAPGLREDDALALTLLSHRNAENSPWDRHIALLPARYNSLMFWSDEEVESLKGTGCYAQAKRVAAQMAEDYEELAARKVDPEAAEGTEGAETLREAYEWFTLDEYKWAVATVWSRFVSVSKAGKMHKCMAPVFDFLNHSPTAPVAHGFRSKEDDADLPEEGALQVLAGEDLAAGEACLNYGPVSNASMLLLYGCVICGNDFDGVDVFATMDPKAPGYTVKKEVFAAAGIDPDRQPFRISLGSFPRTLVGALRVQRANTPGDMEPAKLRAALLEDTMISEVNEREVIDVLRSALTAMLEGYAGDEEEDVAAVAAWKDDGREEAHVEGHVIMHRERAATYVRFAERRTIRYCLNMLGTHESQL